METELAALIVANANRLNELHAAIDHTVRRRFEGPEHFEAWKQACEAVQTHSSTLAFPGGVAEGLERLASGNAEALETAVCFLEVNPWFHGSGYLKSNLIRHLKRLSLPPVYRERLQQVVLARIQDRDVREFRDFCRLAPGISDSLFREQVASLAASPIGIVSRHAGWVLEALAKQARVVGV